LNGGEVHFKISAGLSEKENKQSIKTGNSIYPAKHGSANLSHIIAILNRSNLTFICLSKVIFIQSTCQEKIDPKKWLISNNIRRFFSEKKTGGLPVNDVQK
jgi:hypothetical protein